MSDNFAIFIAQEIQEFFARVSSLRVLIISPLQQLSYFAVLYLLLRHYIYVIIPILIISSLR